LPAELFIAGFSGAVCAFVLPQIELRAIKRARAGIFLEELIGLLLFTGIFQMGAGSIVGDRRKCPLKK
jgi:hypothetical protein